MRVSVRNLGFLAVAGTAAFLLAGAGLPPVLSDAGGLWEVSKSASGEGGEQSCVAQPVALAQWEHRRGRCTPNVVSSSADKAVIHYTCAGGDFGHSQVRVITPRTLRIETQGISGGLPFSYVLHARRVRDCEAH